ncbi:MAG TPA: DUF6491 family protein [Phenylobacterium sp.]
MTWKIALPAVTLAAAALLTAAAPVAAKSPLEEKPKPTRSQCFWTRQVNGFASNDNRIVNIRVGANDIYQLEMFGRCEDVDWNNRIAIVSRGSSYICTGLDAEIIAHNPSGPQRCPVRNIHKLNADEIKALPKHARP